MLKLKEIFPTETEAALEEALRFSINVEDAIETLVIKKTAGQCQYKVMSVALMQVSPYGMFYLWFIKFRMYICFLNVFISNLNCCLYFVSNQLP